MANSVDPDQTAIGAVCSGFTLFASILYFVSNVWQLFAAGDFSRRHFQMHFFLGTLRVKNSFRNIIRVSNSLDPDQARHFVGPDLGPSCLQRLSAEDTSR